jgi:hypothetical protein
MNNSTNLNDISLNLSVEEREYLNKINEQSNLIRRDLSMKKDFFSLSLTEIFNRWASVHNQILEDLSKISYSNKWSLNRVDLWWDNLFLLLDNVIKSVVKEERLIYVGITLIIMSLLIYLIQITS